MEHICHESTNTVTDYSFANLSLIPLLFIPTSYASCFLLERKQCNEYILKEAMGVSRSKIDFPGKVYNAIWTAPKKTLPGSLRVDTLFTFPESLPVYILKWQYHMPFILHSLCSYKHLWFFKTHVCHTVDLFTNFKLFLHCPGISLTVNSHTSSFREGHFGVLFLEL